jgi:chemotaxis signal transduction protein
MPALARYRRRPAQEPTLRLIAFQLRQNHFCLPLAAARRVVFEAADHPAFGTGLLHLDREVIPLVDIAPWVYGRSPLPPLAALGPGPSAAPSSRAILVVTAPPWGSLGLLVEGTPALKRARPSHFSPIPAAYLVLNHLRGLNTLVTLGDPEPPLLLLDLEALLAAQAVPIAVTEADPVALPLLQPPPLQPLPPRLEE